LTGISPTKITTPLNSAPNSADVMIGGLAAGSGFGGLRSAIVPWVSDCVVAAVETAPADNTTAANVDATIRLHMVIRFVFRS